MGQTGAVNTAGGLFRTRLLEKTVDQLEIIFVALGVFERFENLLMIDEIISIHGFRVINSHLYYILSCSEQILRFYVAAVDDDIRADRLHTPRQAADALCSLLAGT